jgi:hypothetical protein
VEKIYKKEEKLTFKIENPTLPKIDEVVVKEEDKISEEIESPPLETFSLKAEESPIQREDKKVEPETKSKEDAKDSPRKSLLLSDVVSDLITMEGRPLTYRFILRRCGSNASSIESLNFIEMSQLSPSEKKALVAKRRQIYNMGIFVEISSIGKQCPIY